MNRRDATLAALMDIVANHGLERVSVREVASHAGVSIGTVQHYFPTREHLLAQAYEEAVGRIRARVEGVRLGPDVRANLIAVLSELLPLDPERAAETRVHLSFATLAATSPGLAATQAAALAELHAAVAAAFDAAWEGEVAARTVALAAHAAVAATDGIALHAVSAGDWLAPRQQRATLRLVVDALLATADLAQR